MRPFRSLTVGSILATNVLLLWAACAWSSDDRETHAETDSHSWIRTLEDRTERGTLQDELQIVRGDTGKWSDTPRLQHAPPIQRKPEQTALDDWSDQLQSEDFQLTADDDNWLLFRTEQLDDNDRVWVERVERQGNSLTVIAHQAVWQGNYRKNFTYHALLGVNLGALEPGDYEATWVLRPLEFSRFEDPGAPRDNWPQDERLAEAEPVVLSLELTIVAAAD